MTSRILISGAGIAGPALAYWMHRFGFQPTIVEKAAAPRRGGQAVDVRGVALDVLTRMQLRERASALGTRMQGVSVLDEAGKEIWRSTERSFSGGRFGSGDLEIYRDDLVRLLSDATQGVAEYLWADSIAALEQAANRVTVEFEYQAPRDFDILVAADGLHSNVRRLVFGEEKHYVKPFGIGLATFGCPNILNLRDWQLSHREAASGYLIFPTRDNSQLRVNLGFGPVQGDSWQLSAEAQKALVAQAFGHYAWEMPRLLQAMHETNDFYFGDVAQVKMTRWSEGNVVLLGDAAYCPSPMSGQGTSLALVGAFVLSSELHKAPKDPARAFERYHSRMQAFVQVNQALADPQREGAVPDDEMDRAKRNIVLDDLDLPDLPLAPRAARAL